MRLVTRVGLGVVLAVTVLASCTGDTDGTSPTTAPPTTAPAPTTTIPPSTTTTVTGAPAQRVLVLGDSGMVDAQPALTAMFEATGAQVAEGAGPGFGLTRLGVRQPWPPYPEAWGGLVDEFDPDLSVVMLGVWDESFVLENGVDAYVATIEDALSILTSGGGRVLWLGTPPGGEIDLTDMNPIFESVARAYPGVVFFGQVEGELRGPDGGFPSSYTSTDGSRVHLRKDDGWHFCADGAARVAARVNELAVLHGLTVPAGDAWRDGDWQWRSNYADAACWS